MTDQDNTTLHQGARIDEIARPQQQIVDGDPRYENNPARVKAAAMPDPNHPDAVLNRLVAFLRPWGFK